jgi:hypothetical protein
MKALSGAKISRIFAGLLLMGVLVIAGHHFVVAASTNALAENAPHHDTAPHPGQEHEGPTPVVEAHSPTPIIQKFQLQKQLETASAIATFVSPIADPPYRLIEPARIAAHIVPLSLPLDLKTTFLN